MERGGTAGGFLEMERGGTAGAFQEYAEAEVLPDVEIEKDCEMELNGVESGFNYSLRDDF
jgi:hypothetical protein